MNQGRYSVEAARHGERSNVPSLVVFHPRTPGGVMKRKCCAVCAHRCRTSICRPISGHFMQILKVFTRNSRMQLRDVVWGFGHRRAAAQG